MVRLISVTSIPIHFPPADTKNKQKAIRAKRDRKKCQQIKNKKQPRLSVELKSNLRSLMMFLFTDKLLHLALIMWLKLWMLLGSTVNT